MQIAKSFGAHVTGLCSIRNAEMVRSIGADRLIDYTQQDFTKNRNRYHLIFDLVVNHPLSTCRRVLNPNGIWVFAGIQAVTTLTALLFRTLDALQSQKIVSLMASFNKADLNLIRKLMEAANVTPVIDRLYSLNEVFETVRYPSKRYARGKVTITAIVGGIPL